MWAVCHAAAGLWCFADYMSMCVCGPGKLLLAATSCAGHGLFMSTVCRLSGLSTCLMVCTAGARPLTLELFAPQVPAGTCPACPKHANGAQEHRRRVHALCSLLLSVVRVSWQLESCMGCDRVHAGRCWTGLLVAA